MKERSDVRPTANTTISFNISVWRMCEMLCYKVVFFVEIKCQLDATEVFIADLIACSTCFGHHYARNMLSKQ